MSDNGGGFDDRYVAYREHAQAQQRTDAELARLRERQATTEATLLHEVAGVRSDVSEMKQMLVRAPAQQDKPDHAALAMQRALDMLDQRRSGGGPSPFLIVFAILGALALGFIAARFLLGG